MAHAHGDYGVAAWPVGLEVLLAFGILLMLGGQQLLKDRDAIVYVPTSEIPWVTLPAFLLAKMFQGRRLVLANLNTQIGLAAKVGGLAGRALWAIHARADRVIALSSAIAAELDALGVSRNVAINSCGFDRPRVDANAPVAVTHGATYVGRLEKAKGMDDLLDAWRNVAKLIPAADLRVIGYATPENYKRFVENRDSFGLSHNVEVVGIVTDESKWILLQESRVCLFLSRVEGWGFVPLEALSLGVPVVAYDLPCYRESLRGLDGVFRVPVGNTTDAADNVARLLAMPEHDYAALRNRIRSSFHYSDWTAIALAELRLIQGTNQTSRAI